MELGLPIEDEAAWYLYSYQTSAIFPYAEDGRTIGEDVYSDGPLNMERIEKLDDDEIPDLLVERLAARASVWGSTGTICAVMSPGLPPVGTTRKARASLFAGRCAGHGDGDILANPAAGGV